MTSFSITTLGCKVNFYESEWISEQLIAMGFSRIDDHTSCPDWAIVNTCTVTNRASRQSRQVIYQAARRCPNTKIVATGCYADLDPEALKALPNVTLVIPNREKISLPGALLPSHPNIPPTNMTLTSFKGHTRAYLMVQNGCNANCSYCIIPRVRGKSRSKPIETVLGELDALSSSGHPEIVLCGIHLGQYGLDLSPRTTLSALLGKIVAHPFEGRVRISSIEPMELNEEIIRQVASSEKICPHFHIPLQSGDREILQRMNRPYTPEMFETLIRYIGIALPDCTIGSDVMVGFPGETDEAFKNTCEFLSRLPVSYLHVFPYSERPKTRSQSLSGKISEFTKKARTTHLLGLAAQKRREFLSSWVGKSDSVVFEKYKGHNLWLGKSAHYIPVKVKSKRDLLGVCTDVKIVSSEQTFVWGRI